MDYYKTIAEIDHSHKVYLVQHEITHKIFIKKILDVYNLDVYKLLHQTPIEGTPQIIDYCEIDGQLILIEEYISGNSLQEILSSAQYNAYDILKYMMDLCEILNRLHHFEPPIIHRDIKPSNIIITSYHHAILLDFNAAKFYSAESSNDTVLLGTQGYAAPEQYGFGSSSPQTDIYALGIMLKEMVTNLPFSTPVFDRIISKCTQLAPQQRYQTVLELKEDFQTLISSNRTNINTKKNFADYLPPGFRTRKLWKMLIASPIYLFILWLCLTLEVENVYGAALWTERIFCLIMMLSIVFICFNYLDIQKHFPLCKHKNKFLHYVGILLFNLIVLFALMMIMVLLVAFVFQVY